MKILSDKEVEMLWMDNCYDGPLSGICKYQDKHYYFNTVIFGGWCGKDELTEGSNVSYEYSEEELKKLEEECDEVGQYSNGLVCESRRYALYPLTETEFKIESAWHKTFDLMVKGPENLFEIFYLIRGTMKKRKYNQKEPVVYWE